RAPSSSSWSASSPSLARRRRPALRRRRRLLWCSRRLLPAGGRAWSGSSTPREPRYGARRGAMATTPAPRRAHGFVATTSIMLSLRGCTATRQPSTGATWRWRGGSRCTCTRKGSRRSCMRGPARTSTQSRAASSSSSSSWRRRRPASGRGTPTARTPSSSPSASSRWCTLRTATSPTTAPRSSLSSATTSASSPPATPSGTAPPAPTTSCSPATTGYGPDASKGDPELYANGIRALCNANTSEGFRPGKDVSIPEINLYDGDTPRQLLGPSPGLSARPYLAFFAGGRHGHVRDLLLRHWKGRDPATFPVYEYDLPSTSDYFAYMHRSRFCLCPSGHEVASPRVVEAIHAGCVPVLVSDGYALPFADVLRWESFSVSVPVADIPRLKEVLEGIPTAEVERLRDGVRLVKRHFTLRQPPERLDMFHMILHSVWLRRLNFRLDH
uniref:Exostosin GT47 domain-containing protein n=1 Tax=Aegilops tauschii subsp. strangulata TaxID=200361 RepID=A0A453QWD0_AEGTS